MFSLPLLKKENVSFLFSLKAGICLAQHCSTIFSSFMYLLEDNARFAAVSNEIGSIIKKVQLGNRSLQNIAVYAKVSMFYIHLESIRSDCQVMYTAEVTS